MGIFKTIGALSDATASVITTSASTVTEVAKAGQISASVLTIKAKSLKEEAVIEAKSNRLDLMAKYKALKNKIGTSEEATTVEDEFDALMKEYE